MKFKQWWILAFAALGVLPAVANADVSVVQDSCAHFEVNQEQFLRVYFSVVNFNQGTPICDLHFVPEGSPVDPGCVMVDCAAPAGWTCALRSDGGADYQTVTDCLTPGHIRRNFSFTLDPEFCCYIVQFTDASGGVVVQTEECFSCVAVGVEPNTWGNVKRLYQ